MAFWKKLTNSIKSPTFVKEVYKETNGQAFKYLFLMFTLVFLIVAIPTTIKSFEGISAIKSDFAEKVPDFKLKNGQLQFSGQQPYTQEVGGLTIIVDTTGATTEESIDKDKQALLFTKTKVIQKQAGKTTTYNLSDFKGTNLDKKTILDAIPYLKLIVIILALLAYLFYLLKKVVGILIFALFASTITKRKDVIDFSKAINIVIYSSTLATFIQGIVMLSPAIVPFLLFLPIYSLIVLTYTTKGIRAIEAEI